MYLDLHRLCCTSSSSKGVSSYEMGSIVAGNWSTTANSLKLEV